MPAAAAAHRRQNSSMYSAERNIEVTIESAGRVVEGIEWIVAVSDDTPRVSVAIAARLRSGQTPCIVCGGTRWSRLPDPGPICMVSDGRSLPEPLGRMTCDGCGLGWRPSPGGNAGRYCAGYKLYAHAPTDARETARQALYADWIAAQIAVPPRQVLDGGCGNGSLLSGLGARWPDAALFGCDLSAESVAHGLAHGLRL